MVLSSLCHLFLDYEPNWGCSTIYKVHFGMKDMHEVLLQAFRRFLFAYIQSNVGLNFVLSVRFCIRCCLGLEACLQI